MFYGYDEIVFYAYYFIFSVYCFWLKDNEMIFGCIGLTDTVVCSNLSYSCSVCCLCNNCLTRDALCYLEKKMDSRIISVWYSLVGGEVEIITFIVVTITVVFSGVYSEIL